MSLGKLNSVPETAFGFRTKVKIFLQRIELLRKHLGVVSSEMRILDLGCGNGVQMTFRWLRPVTMSPALIFMSRLLRMQNVKINFQTPVFLRAICRQSLIIFARKNLMLLFCLTFWSIFLLRKICSVNCGEF